ncbi:MAG: 6-phosphogluconolactonase [Actinomycetia bacterium]|nr:6-phosphogluconolactonase [Actinomycetes bacterium]
MTVEIIVHPTPEALAASVAARLITSIIDAQAARGDAHIVLTGGGMGGKSQEAVVASPAAAAINWDRVDFYWGDERYLPLGHPDRNETQARAAILDPLNIAQDRIHAMPASDGPYGADIAAAARGHAAELAALAAPGADIAVPVFDVLMLGVGPDAHVASLFPNHPQTAVTDVTVTDILDSPKPPPQRLTYTFPVLQSAAEVWLVAAGAEKAHGLAGALAPGANKIEYPAAGAVGTQRTLALIDDAAAAELPAAVLHRS